MSRVKKIKIEDLTEDLIDSEYGFGNDKSIAISLLKDVINILNEFNISNFLIAGTLLGHIRHNGFIPWDDDIDLMVDESILEKLPLINDKYGHIFNIGIKNKSIKFFYKDIGTKINHIWINKYMNSSTNYNFPFVDLFVCEQHPKDKSCYNFFGKKWQHDVLFPLKKASFIGIDTYIPNNTHKFLEINYGSDYMTKFKLDGYSHRNEKTVRNVLFITKEQYEKIYSGK